MKHINRFPHETVSLAVRTAASAGLCAAAVLTTATLGSASAASAAVPAGAPAAVTQAAAQPAGGSSTSCPSGVIGWDSVCG